MEYVSYKKILECVEEKDAYLVIFYPKCPRYIEIVPDIYVYNGDMCIGRVFQKYYDKLKRSGHMCFIKSKVIDYLGCFIVEKYKAIGG